MDIVKVLNYLRPGEKWDLNYPCTSYSDIVWRDATEQPTEQEMLDAELAAAKADRIARIKVEAQQRILADYPDWKQRNAALGLDAAQDIQDLKDGITAIRDASDTAETAVNALSSVEDVVNFTW